MPKILIVIAILILSTGCSTKLITVHKLDVQQGNALTEADIGKITRGMSSDQVTQTLGAPVLNPVFNNKRWDYIYYRQKPYLPVEKILLSIYFENQVVVKTEKKISGNEK